MKPIGPMMREHRLIERMLVLMEHELAAVQARKKVDPVFIETAVDFFTTYADRTHHGKEEEIYFRDLASKDIDEEHRHTLAELIEEHTYARAEVRALLEANEEYAAGRPQVLGDLTRYLTALVDFCPGHIEREDKHFFFRRRSISAKMSKTLCLESSRTSTRR